MKPSRVTYEFITSSHASEYALSCMPPLSPLVRPAMSGCAPRVRNAKMMMPNSAPVEGTHGAAPDMACGISSGEADEGEEVGEEAESALVSPAAGLWSLSAISGVAAVASSPSVMGRPSSAMGVEG